MRICIEHHTAYDYAAPVSLAAHFVRTFPRTEPGRLIQKLTFKTNSAADVQFRRDLFDNNFARCSYSERTEKLVFDLRIEIDLQKQNPFHFLVDYYAYSFPFQYLTEDWARLASYLTLSRDSASVDTDGRETKKLLPLSFWQVPEPGGETVAMIASLIRALHEHIAYEVRDEGTARAPSETLELGRGACRDTAVLLAAILRELGLAARLVSGYLCELHVESNQRHSDRAMHLWTEVYLPGAGWVGLDPTNGQFCDENFIATAVGLTTAEITPIRGAYIKDGDTVVPSTMSANLELSLLD